MLKTSAALLLLSATAIATPRSELQRWKLDNGLEVIFVADHKAPVVAVQMVVHAGGKDEPADRRGLGHLIEHLMWKGSRRVAAGEHAQLIESLGGRSSARTTDDLARFADEVPPAALDFALELEAERLRNLTLTQANIDGEREIVKEELRLKLDGSPIERATAEVHKLAFTKHPYRLLPIGTRATLDAIGVADCQHFYDVYYQPNNVTLIIVGDTDEATVKAAVDKRFASIPRGPDVPRPSAALAEPAQTQRREATLEVQVAVPVVIAAYHAPAGDAADLFALEVLAQILGSGDGSRVAKRLSGEKLAVSVVSELWLGEDPGLMMVYAAAPPAARELGPLKAALIEEIGKLRAKAPPAAELQRAKNQLAAQATYRRERVGELTAQLAVDAVVSHDPARGLGAAQRFDAVSAADVQRVAKKLLTDGNLTLVTLLPPKTESP